MARALPDTPRRVTRSSSRARPAADSDDETTTKTPRRNRSATRKATPSKSPSKAKKETPKKERQTSRTRSGSKKVAESDDEEEIVTAKRSSRAKSPAKSTKKSPVKSTKKVVDEDDDEEEEQPRQRRGRSIPAKKVESPAKVTKSPAKKAQLPPVRVRSRSRGRKTQDSDDSSDETSTSEEPKVAPKSPKLSKSPTKKITHKVEESDSDEPEAIMYRTKTPTVIVKTIDYVYLVLIGFIPLFASALNMWHVSPVVRQVMANRCPRLALLNNFKFPLWQILIANFALYLITAVLIAFKLRKSNTLSFVTTTITSMIFRLYVSLSILVTFCGLYFCKQHIPELILEIVSISLLTSSAADLFYAFNTSSAARLFENVFSVAISYYVLFQLPVATNDAVKQLPAPLLSSLVLYAVVSALIAFGSVGVLSTTNATNTSKTITAISHACIWLHTIVALVGPVIFFFKEVQQHLTVQFTKPAIIARAVAVAAAVLLNFTSYADAVNVDLSSKK